LRAAADALQHSLVRRAEAAEIGLHFLKQRGEIFRIRQFEKAYTQICHTNEAARPKPPSLAPNFFTNVAAGVDFFLSMNRMGTSKGTAMSKSEKFIVLPFKKIRGNIAPGEMRAASNAASAEKIARAMAERFVGVAAYSVQVDMESGDMSDPKVLWQAGEIADIAA